jgi:hypothetical protein
MSATSWRRVTATNRCPICGRAKWCLVAADGSAAICPHVQSDRRCGDAGWLHRLQGGSYAAAPPPPGPPAVPRAGLAWLAERYRQAVDPGRLYQLAASLGVSTRSLTALGIGWSQWHSAWTFPMRDTNGGILGIRLRLPDGRKLAVRGGHEGLFLPAGWDGEPECRRLLVAEGTTDVAALYDMGFVTVVGRPSCQGGVRLLTELVERHRPREVVVVADNDPPGRQGAERLAGVLIAAGQTVRVILPPAGVKDARAWLVAGGTRADVERALGATPARRPAAGPRVLASGLVGGKGRRQVFRLAVEVRV